MATLRDTPYGAFNYLVNLGDGQTEGPQAGFSDVSGLGTELSFSEYRAGNDKVNTARKVANTYRQEDVVLRRGVVGDIGSFWAWLTTARRGGIERRTVVITLMSEDHSAAVMTFKLINAQPKKWVGPTLAAKGGGEVAMEEIHLTHEGIEIE